MCLPLKRFPGSKHEPPIDGEGRQEGPVFEKRTLGLVEVFFGHGDEEKSEAGGEGSLPPFGEELGHPETQKLLLDAVTSMIDDEADHGGDGKRRLHGEAGPQVDDAH